MEQRERRLDGVRIAFIVPSLDLGGSERQALLLARQLVRRANARVGFVSLGPLGRLTTACDDLGVPFEAFKLWHPIRGRWAQAVDVLRFAALVRRRRFEVLLPYCMFENVLAGLTWRAGGARTCIWNQRDEGRMRLEPWVERLAVRRTPCFVANSTHGASFLSESLGIARDRLHVIRNGVDLPPPRSSRAEWRSRLGLPEAAFAACMLANIHRFKDHATLVRAWRRVVDRLEPRTAAHLLLAGYWGDRYQATADLSRALSLGSRIHFLGQVDDVAGLLQAADVAVFSSQAEGLPNGVLEPMASALPVVATDYPGIREAVGRAGFPFLAPPGDDAAFGERIVRLAENPDARRSLGVALCERVTECFSVEAMGEQMIGLIASQLESQPGL